MNKEPIRIPLSKNGTKYAGMYEALVSPEDADLNEFNWQVAIDMRTEYERPKYARRHGKNENIHMHRVIMERVLGRPLDKKELVDHLDRNGLNNQRNNLCIVDARQNNRNSRRNKKHGFIGITRNKSGNWQAAIKIKGKSKHLGTFKDPYDAQAKYFEAVKLYRNSE